MSNAGEIYSIISGLVDQKFAERKQDQRPKKQPFGQKVETATYEMQPKRGQHHKQETFSPMMTIPHSEDPVQQMEPVHLILNHAQKSHIRNPSDFAEARFDARR